MSVASRHPLRVLSADDHPVNLRYLELLLRGDGHEVHNCADGQQALDAARAQVFDVVLMDLHMPVMDGATAIAAIRALPAPHGSMRIIAITADTAESARQRLMDAGANGFLAKPVTPQALRAAMTESLQAAATAPVAPPASDTPPTVDAERLAELRELMPADALQALMHEVMEAPTGSLATLLTLLDAEGAGMPAPGGTQALAEAAHKLKGSAMMLGLSALHRVAGLAEQRLRAPGAGPAVALAFAAALRDQAARTRTALRARLPT
jgi:CheY-like chemotaxis protein